MFNNSLDSILKEFTKLNNKLEKFISVSNSERDTLSRNIDDLVAKQQEIAAATNRAETVLNNLKALIGG